MSHNNIRENVILVINDGTKDTSELLNALQTEDFTVLTAEDSMDVMAIAKSELPQIIIIDLASSEMAGWKICKQLKANRLTNRISLILTGAVADTPSRIKEFNWDSVDYILSPTKPEEIITRIKTHLALQKLAQQFQEEIVARRKAEAKLEQEMNQAQSITSDYSASEQDVEKFAAMVFDDLQTPLDSLTMFAESLAEEYGDELDADASEYIEQLTDSGSEMEALMQDLLLYSRIGKGDETWIAVNLAIPLEDVTQNLQAAIAETEATIVVEDLPSVLINPQEISQLWQNLIENSLKFRSERQPRIEIKGTQQQQEWLITVKDNGIGIESKFQEQIFEVFQRLHPPETYPGTGIGLAVCQKIVERYGGKIWVESELGQGSTFYFTLPANCLPQKVTTSNENYHTN